MSAGYAKSGKYAKTKINCACYSPCVHENLVFILSYVYGVYDVFNVFGKKTNAVLLRLLVKGIQTRYSDYKGTKMTVAGISVEK